jgi:hypothetical protein
MTRDGERADRAHAQGIAIGRRFGREIEPERERAAGAVIDHDLLMKFVGQGGGEDAGERIGRAAGGLRHDHADRVVGIFGPRSGCEYGIEQGESEQYAAIHEEFRLAGCAE